MVAGPLVGAGLIGPLVAIGTGTYTGILSISAPASASPGELVSVEVLVQNLHSSPINIAVTAEGVDVSFVPGYALASGYAVQAFTASFIMPNNDVRLHVWSWYWADSEWHWDDYGYVDIALIAAPEVYAGTISRMELEHDESRINIPAYDVPQNLRGLVHIWGRNDMSSNQKMGISWIVRAPPGYPDGPILEEYYDWEMFTTGPGDEHEFIGGRFNLDEVGLYDIRCGLLMNPDNPVYVHTYYGDLCIVAAVVPEAEFRGFGISEYLSA